MKKRQRSYDLHDVMVAFLFVVITVVLPLLILANCGGMGTTASHGGDCGTSMTAC